MMALLSVQAVISEKRRIYWLKKIRVVVSAGILKKDICVRNAFDSQDKEE